MKTSELKTGRTFAVAFEHGDDFMASLTRFCVDNGVRQGYIPMFLAGFAEADIVGTCDKLDDPKAPVWSKVHVTNAEALGCGTIARDGADGILPHIHTSVGLKEHSATAHTSHLLAAKVQFLTEMIIVEVDTPEMTAHATTTCTTCLCSGSDSQPRCRGARPHGVPLTRSRDNPHIWVAVALGTSPCPRLTTQRDGAAPINARRSADRGGYSVASGPRVLRPKRCRLPRSWDRFAGFSATSMGPPGCQ
jgi:predicted DNA-binding protein with PD1-like motif